MFGPKEQRLSYTGVAYITITPFLQASACIYGMDQHDLQQYFIVVTAATS